MDTSEFISESDKDYEFAAGSPQAILSQTGAQGDRTARAPANDIQTYRLIADTDPVVGEAIDTLVDYMMAGGFNIEPANVVGTDEQQTDQDIAELKFLVENSRFEEELRNFIWHALVDGTAFMELVIENDHFKPKVLPGEEMEIDYNEFGRVEEFIQSPSQGDDVTFAPHEVMMWQPHSHPNDEFGTSLVSRIEEQADMLRDMELDTARFVATKAYPPVVWQCGTEERPWSQDQIDEWLNTIQNIEPDSMLAVGHDVDHDVAGITSTSSTAGAMRLEPVFEHLMTRMATGLGVPADLLNIDTLSGTALQTAMQKFERRVQRYRNQVRQVVRYQLFPSVLEDSTAAEFDGLPPNFEFGEHSSEEERLEARTALQLLNNGLLTPEAAAKRLGIDPETELPDIWSGDLMSVLQQLAGNGDDIQNPDGGRPTDTGGGTQSEGREATTRENPNEDNSGERDRPQEPAESQ